MNRNRLMILAALAAILAPPAAHGQGEKETYSISLRPQAQIQETVDEAKLSRELRATLASGGVLLGRTDEGNFVVSSEQEGADRLRESPLVSSVNSDVPREYRPVTRLRISYDAQSKPTEDGLKEMGLELVEDYEKGTFMVVRPRGGITAEVAKRLQESPDVRYATAVYRVKAIAPPPAEPEDRPEVENPPTNDPRWDDLWGMRNIRASEAWKQVHDSPAIVAVIDTGVDYDHPDLRDNIWTNPAEQRNGKDDDGNGLVDDIHGADFANSDGDPDDDNDHGSHCAGTIGAVGNNCTDVIGVNWQVQIMALKWLDEGGFGDIIDAIKCIDYAIEHDAKVLSNSWYWPEDDPELREAIRRALEADVLFVAAASNFNNDNDRLDSRGRYPSAYDLDNVIAVMAIDEGEEKAGFSNFGDNTVHLGAPGVGILSTIANGSTDFFDGTSMATPHVAGAAALILAHSSHKDSSAEEIRDLIVENVRKIDGLEGKCITEGTLDISFLSSSAGISSSAGSKVSSPRQGLLLGAPDDSKKEHDPTPDRP